MQEAMRRAQLVAPTGAQRTRFGETPLYQEGLWDLGSGVLAWLVPNGSWGEANAGLIAGDGASLLVDTLWDERLTGVMLDAMIAHTAKAPIATVVNTHADGDHWWGNALVPDAEIVTSQRALADMDLHEPRAMLMFGRVGRVLRALPYGPARKVGHYFAAMGEPYDFKAVRLRPPTRSFSGETTIEVGGRQFRLIEAGPAHTAGDLMVHVPDARVLFTGDTLFIGSTPVMWAGPLENWLNALDRMLALDADVIVPGHGPLTDKDGVRLVRSYWELVGEEARRHYDDGLTADRAARAIVTSAGFKASPFARWDSPERIMTNVHLLYRHYRGQAKPLSMLQTVDILRRQALLAHEIPGARPRAMRWSDDREENLR